MLSEAEFHESLRQERRQSLAAGRAFAEACRRSDLQAFHETVNFINEATCDGWRHAMRWAARLDQRVDEAISEAFLKAWIENKSIADNFESSSMLIPALRNLLPAYTGLGLPALPRWIREGKSVAAGTVSRGPRTYMSPRNSPPTAGNARKAEVAL